MKKGGFHAIFIRKDRQGAHAREDYSKISSVFNLIACEML
jgi:hypothetical protein